MLLDGATLKAHVTATLVSLAAKGAIKLRGGDTARVEIVDEDLAEDPYEKLIMSSLVDSSSLAPAGYTIAPWSLESLRETITVEADQTAQEKGWFLRRVSSLTPLTASDIVGMNLLALVLIALVACVVGSLVSSDFLHGLLSALQWAYTRLWPLFILLIIYLALYSFGLMPKRLGLQRSAIGRALTDQCEGFVGYLTTPDADRVEGDNTFTRYLPWAILVGEADKWTSICASAPQAQSLENELTRLYSDVAPPVGSVSEALAALIGVEETTSVDALVSADAEG
jgi:hypothetical protein